MDRPGGDGGPDEAVAGPVAKARPTVPDGLQAALPRRKGDRRPSRDGRRRPCAGLGHGGVAGLRFAAGRGPWRAPVAARMSAAARSCIAMRCCTTRTAKWDDGTYIPLQHIKPGQASFDIIDSVLSEAGGAGLRIRLFHVRPERARDLGSAVRRFRQRRAGRHRPVHHVRRSEVGPRSAAWCCCCRTATKDRDRSTRRRASSVSCSFAPSTTCRSACHRRQRRYSTCCGGRCCASSASR